LNEAEYQNIYDSEERQWWYRGMRGLSLALLEAPLRALRPDRTPLRLLDAGCGTGRNLEDLARFGRAAGVDLSPDAIRFCRRRGAAAVRAGLLHLPFPDATFDCVTSFDVVYHAWVTDDRAAVREMARVLRPGGLLFVRVPALMLLWGGHDVEVHSRHRYTKGELLALLRDAGLVTERASYCNSILFPVLLLRRGLDRLTGRTGSDVGFLPAPLEWLFHALLRLEARLVRGGLSFPVGASVMALARKPGSRDPGEYNRP
jgi:SAM-dependent methyltransferase